jgi:hypothetical protein
LIEEIDRDASNINEKFLNFSLREEILYGDKSFFDDLSMI